MKKYTQKNWNLLVSACSLGLLWSGLLIYQSQGGITTTALIAFGFVVLLVLLILWVVNRFFRVRG